MSEFRAALEEVEISEANRMTHYDFEKYMVHINGCKGGSDQACACGMASVRWNLDTLVDAGEMARLVLDGKTVEEGYREVGRRERVRLGYQSTSKGVE
jgi:hypothetical protein